MTKHTLSVLVENKPGVLARVSGLFSRRGFNIDSLAVGETEHPEVLTSLAEKKALGGGVVRRPLPSRSPVTPRLPQEQETIVEGFEGGTRTVRRFSTTP